MNDDEFDKTAVYVGLHGRYRRRRRPESLVRGPICGLSIFYFGFVGYFFTLKMMGIDASVHQDPFSSYFLDSTWGQFFMARFAMLYLPMVLVATYVRIRPLVKRLGERGRIAWRTWLTLMLVHGLEFVTMRWLFYWGWIG